MTEWQMSKKLASKWAKTGFTIGRQKLLLVSWEVMTPSWKFNTAADGWEPSIDFLFLDSQMGLWAMELKNHIKTARDSWLALCQVTHRAFELSKTYSPRKLKEIHRICHYGSDSWIPASDPEELSLIHRRFFALSQNQTIPLQQPKVRRLVAAKSFSPEWHKTICKFNSSQCDEIASHLQETYKIASKSNREMHWLLGCGDWHEHMIGHVEHVSLQ